MDGSIVQPFIFGSRGSVDMAQDRISAEWMDITGKLRHRWRKLRWEDVLVPVGNAEYLARKLEERYGIDRHEARLQVYEFESGL